MIESLTYTLLTEDDTVREKWVRKLKAHSQKRNAASYDAAGAVSPNDLAQIIRDPDSLKVQVMDYLQQTHPDLLPG